MARVAASPVSSRSAQKNALVRCRARLRRDLCENARTMQPVCCSQLQPCTAPGAAVLLCTIPALSARNEARKCMAMRNCQAVLRVITACNTSLLHQPLSREGVERAVSTWHAPWRCNVGLRSHLGGAAEACWRRCRPHLPASSGCRHSRRSAELPRRTRRRCSYSH
jgi:hypothetical protein